MIFEPDDRLKQKMAKNGSVLQYMYSVSGAGKGVMALGIMLAVIGAALAAVLTNTMGTQGAVTFGAAMIIPGIHRQLHKISVLRPLRIPSGGSCGMLLH